MGRMAGLSLAIGLACGTALAQDVSWPEAERLARAQFTALGETVAAARRMPDLHLGRVLWVQRVASDGTGHGDLVFVRGERALVAHGIDGVMAVLRADDAVHARAWTALALFDVLRYASVPIPLPTAAVRTHPIRALRPQLTRTGDTLAWSVFTGRGGPPEAPTHEVHWMTRATLTLGLDYVPHWTLTDLNVDGRGHTQWESAPRTP